MQTQTANTQTVFHRASYVRVFAIAIALALMWLSIGASAIAAGPEAFNARLSPLGVTNATVNTTTGAGLLKATLNGSQLIIEGTFEGLTGNATSANIRRGPKGIPGPVIFDIPIAKAANGKINAALTLNAEQMADLRAGRLYVQIHSERAPEGSIRGWML